MKLKLLYALATIVVTVASCEAKDTAINNIANVTSMYGESFVRERNSVSLYGAVNLEPLRTKLAFMPVVNRFVCKYRSEEAKLLSATNVSRCHNSEGRKRARMVVLAQKPLRHSSNLSKPEI
uniref:Uncharacterized protein n=1 Tax=Anopheles culicifacies TaxID=139723 RepID=A0A182MTS7_9DIPT